MSTNMGNLEKLGILVIVILVVVVGVVAITPKSTVDDRFAADKTDAAAVAPETPLEPVAGADTTNPWPGKDAPAVVDPKTLPGPGVATLDAKATPAQPAAPEFRTIKVQRGDTPAIIAKRELHNAARYKEILDANPGLVASKLTAGMEIKIPVGPAKSATPTTPAPSTTGATDSTAAATTTPPASVTTPPVASSEEKTYVVKKGDTLSSIASHEMGGKAKWGELAKANDDVLHGSTELKIGMKLKIPAAGAESTKSSGAESAVASRDVPEKSTEKSTSAGGEREYVVKAGDSLWSIAKAECGSDLKDLRAENADVLKGGDTIHVGMKLKLPAKK